MTDHAATTAVVKRGRQIALQRLAIAVGVVTLLAILGAQVLYAVRDNTRQQQIESLIRDARSQATQNHKLSEQVRSILVGVRSCTTPHGKCAQAGQQASIEQTGAVNETTIVAALCVAQLLLHPQTLTDHQVESRIRTCVVKQTAR